MASKNIKGITVEIGGNTTGLQKALGDVNAKSRDLKSELREVDRALKLDPTNVELLAQKQAILMEAIGNTSEKLERLKSVQGQVERQFNSGEIGIEQYRAFQRELINTQSELDNLQSQIENSNNITTDLGNAFEDAVSETQDLENAMNDLGDAAEGSGDGFTIVGGAISEFVGNALTDLASSAQEGIENLWGLADSTREYRDQMSKLDAAAQDGGYTTDYATEKYKELYGILGDETASNTTVSNFMAMGASQKTLDSLVNSSIGIWAKYGDSIPLDGLAESINETAKVGQITGGLADALNWAGISEDEFNKKLKLTASEQERQNLIARTLDGTYGALSESYQETNSSVIDANKSNSDYTDSLAQMGEKIEPVTTTVKNGINDVIKKALELIQNVDFNKVKTKIQTAFGAVTNTIIPAIISKMKWLMKNLPTIATLVGGITLAIVAQTAATKIKTVIDKAAAAGTTVMKMAQQGLNTAMKANMIGIIITAVTALVAAFVYLWNNCEGFRKFWINLWESVKIITSTVITAIGNFFVNLWESIKIVFSVVGNWFSDTFNTAVAMIKLAFSTIGAFFTGIWNGIKDVFSAVGLWFGGIFSGAWTAIKNAFGAVGEFFGGIWDTIKEKFTTIGTTVAEAIGGAFKSAINAVLATVEGAINFIPNAINGALDKINELPGVDIPSMNTISLPRLAKGGVVSSGQAIFAEAGPEMLSVVNGKAYVTPLTGSAKNTAMSNVNNGGATYNITNVVNVKSVSSNYDVRKIDTQLATLQKQRLSAQGGI